MGDFAVLVITEPDQNFRQQVETLLHPYCLRRQVPEHGRVCDCAARSLQIDAEQFAGENGVRLVSLARHYLPRAWYIPGPNGERIIPTKGPDADSLQRENLTAWEAHIQPYVKLIERFKGTHGYSYGPKPDCCRCRGTGRYRTTENPIGAIARRRLGGRWLGQFNGKDFAPVEDVLALPDVTCHMIVTPKGTWYFEGLTRFWKKWVGEKRPYEWECEWRGLLALYPGHLVVTVEVTLPPGWHVNAKGFIRGFGDQAPFGWAPYSTSDALLTRRG